MASVDPASMEQARARLNSDRQSDLFDYDRVETEMQELLKDPKRREVSTMEKKYSYLKNASPTLFRLAMTEENINPEPLVKLLRNLGRVRRNEMTHDQVGASIFLPSV